MEEGYSYYETENFGRIPGGIRKGLGTVKSMARLGDIAILTNDLWNSIQTLAQDPLVVGPLENRGYPIDFYQELERRYNTEFFSGVSRAFNSLPQDPSLTLIGPVIHEISDAISNPLPSIEEELDFSGRMIGVPIQVLPDNLVKVERYVLPAREFASFCYFSGPDSLDYLREPLNTLDIKPLIRKSKHRVFQPFIEFLREEWKILYGEGK